MVSLSGAPALGGYAGGIFRVVAVSQLRSAPKRVAPGHSRRNCRSKRSVDRLGRFNAVETGLGRVALATSHHICVA